MSVITKNYKEYDSADLSIECSSFCCFIIVFAFYAIIFSLVSKGINHNTPTHVFSNITDRFTLNDTTEVALVSTSLNYSRH